MVKFNESGDFECDGCGKSVSPWVFTHLHNDPKKAAARWIKEHINCEKGKEKVTIEEGLTIVDRRRNLLG